MSQTSVRPAFDSGPSLSSLRVWWLACRPKTLTAALIPIVVGTALAYSSQKTIQPVLSILAFLSALSIQIGTNLINDALDFKKGADTKERLGPQRVTQSGLLSAQQVLWGGFACFLLATVLAIPLVISGGWPLIEIGIVSLMAGYAYTGGPYPLAYVGLGDLFVVIFFGWIAVGGVHYLNTGVMNWNAAVAGTQVGFLATVLIAINNLRDHLTDRKANKKTLAVRLGPDFVRFEIAALSLLPFFAGVYWYNQGFVWATYLPLLTFPMAVALIRKVYSTPPGMVYNQFLAQAAALHMGFGFLLSLGLCLG